MLNKKNVTIFLVDDDVLCLNLYAQFMKQQGYSHIHLFDNGHDCIKYLEQIRPSIIFLDYNMDEMNGLDVLKEIREKDPTIVVVFISGEQDKTIARHAIEQGAMDFIIKSSINADKIREVMDKVEDQLSNRDIQLKEAPSFLKRLFSN
jgi:DNA-binding NtrC family response regulator